ncbi:Mitochondrial fission factor [Liparis tanakae]|uniref:Mitochondrial fission factor n=1 Tax=Liparis tanakae TaxID=230148 RepID=A0A4Z2ECP6_9TELE|nr:Mitochondrial fission factor [Liparis tanakae]
MSQRVQVYRCTGDGSDPQFPRPRDLDLIQATPLESLSLKTPPRVLTLSERPLDFLEEEQAAPGGEEVLAPQTPVRRRSASEAASRHGSQPSRHDSAAPAAPPCPSSEDERGLLSFLQSTTRRAYQQVLEVLDENPRRTTSRGPRDLGPLEETLRRDQVQQDQVQQDQVSVSSLQHSLLPRWFDAQRPHRKGRGLCG